MLYLGNVVKFVGYFLSPSDFITFVWVEEGWCVPGNRIWFGDPISYGMDIAQMIAFCYYYFN